MDNVIPTGSREGYLIFLAGGKEYGINVKIISTILNPLKNFSHEQPFLIGTSAVIIDELMIPVIDLYELLDLESPPPDKDTRIIVTDFNDHKSAFYVERIKEFISVVTDSIMRFETPALRQSIIKQYIIMPGRNILLPDFERIFVEKF